MSNISPHSLLSGFEYLLRQARLHLREGRLDEAEQMLDEAAQEEPAHPNVLILRDALLGARLVEEKAHLNQTSNIHLLEQELRFAMALMTLLFFTGIWGFWRSSNSGHSQNGGSPLGGLPTIGSPTQSRHHHGPRSRPRPPARLQNKKQAPRLMSTRSVPKTSVRSASRKRRRRRRRFSFSRVLSRTQHLNQRNVRRRKMYPHRHKSAKVLQKAKSISSKRRRTRRKIRFGEAALASEVPSQWCGTKLRYGPYFPCLKRGTNRRCLKRAVRKKYGCLRIRRRR